MRNNFEKLGLSSTFRIADETELLPISREIMEGLITEFYDRYSATESDTAFREIKANRFARALDHLLSNRSDGKLTETLLDFLEGFYSYPEGIGLLKNCANELEDALREDFLQTSYGRALVDYHLPLFGALLQDLDRIDASLEYDPDAHAKCLALLSSDRDFCTRVCQTLTEGVYEPVQAAVETFFSGRFPSFSKATKPPEVAAYQSWRSESLKTAVEKLKEVFSLPVQEIHRQIRETADLCSILYELFDEFESRLMAEKNLRGILQHNDVRAMVLRLLTDAEGDPSAFADSIAAEYDAVYIDEYQDVDSIQDRIFSLIGRDRRFMVGDIKQSIYGFRGSDPSIFSSYRRKFPNYESKDAETATGNSIFMSENFRCDKPVIDFANAVCSFLFSACEKTVGYREVDDLKHSKRPPEQPPEGYPFPVEVALFEKPDTKEGDEESEPCGTQEASWVAAELSRLLRTERLASGAPLSPSDVAILVRDRKHGIKITRALQALSIPVASDAAADFLHEPILIHLMNLLRTIDNPYRDLPLSEFLLSPLGGFSTEELLLIREQEPKTRALFDALQAAKEHADALPEPLLQKVESMLSWLSRQRGQAEVLPADRFLRLLYLDERLVEYSTEPALMMLYDQARTYQKSSWCGLYGYLGYIEKLIDGEKISAAGFAKAENAVTVMTIHHSKGLEFPVVFLVSTGSAFSNMDAYASLLFHPEVGVASKLYVRESGAHENTILWSSVLTSVKLEQREEAIRTLYVALTRARERLYVTGTLTTKWEKATFASSLVQRGNRTSILSCNSYLSWILAVKHHCETKGIKFPCTFRHILPDETVLGEGYVPSSTVRAVGEKTPAADPVSARYAEILRTSLQFEYPMAVLQGLPSKVAASKLQPDLLDRILSDEEDEMLEAQIELMSSSAPTFERLLEDRKTPSAADIGTATHAFLEFCDFDRLKAEGVSAEYDRLVAQGFMHREEAKLVRLDAIEAFRHSDLFRLIESATCVRREQKISMHVPLSELTADRALAERLGSYPLFVQGSIDLLLEMPNGELLLVDYKTDRITDAERKDPSLLQERMRRRHGTQLSYYARAVKGLFGKAPNRSYLYSIPLGRLIEL